MLKLIRSNNKLKSWKSTKERSTWRKDKRKSLLPKPSWSKSNRTRWTPWRKSWKRTWTKDWSWERLSTTSFSKDIRTSRRKLKTNRISKELSLKKHTPSFPSSDQQLLKVQLWDPRCKLLQEWRVRRWEAAVVWLETQLPSHLNSTESNVMQMHDHTLLLDFGWLFQTNRMSPQQAHVGSKLRRSFYF